MTDFEFISGALGDKVMQYARVYYAGSSKPKHKAAERLLKEARSCERTFGAQFSDDEKPRVMSSFKCSTMARQVQGIQQASSAPCYMCGRPGHFKVDSPLNKPVGQVVLKAPKKDEA